MAEDDQHEGYVYPDTDSEGAAESADSGGGSADSDQG